MSRGIKFLEPVTIETYLAPMDQAPAYARPLYINGNRGYVISNGPQREGDHVIMSNVYYVDIDERELMEYLEREQE